MDMAHAGPKSLELIGSGRNHLNLHLNYATQRRHEERGYRRLSRAYLVTGFRTAEIALANSCASWSFSFAPTFVT